MTWQSIQFSREAAVFVPWQSMQMPHVFMKLAVNHRLTFHLAGNPKWYFVGFKGECFHGEQAEINQVFRRLVREGVEEYRFSVVGDKKIESARPYMHKNLMARFIIGQFR